MNQNLLKTMHASKLDDSDSVCQNSQKRLRPPMMCSFKDEGNVRALRKKQCFPKTMNKIGPRRTGFYWLLFSVVNLYAFAYFHCAFPLVRKKLATWLVVLLQYST